MKTKTDKIPNQKDWNSVRRNKHLLPNLGHVRCFLKMKSFNSGEEAFLQHKSSLKHSWKEELEGEFIVNIKNMKIHKYEESAESSCKIDYNPMHQFQ